MFSNEEIGRRLETRREELHLTMQEVASRVGVARSTVQRYEKGKIRKIKLPVIESFAAALNVNPSWLIGKSSEKCAASRECCTNIQSFKVSADRDLVLTPDEIELLRKYRQLDERGQASVRNTLDHEYTSSVGETASSPAKEA